MTLRVILQIVPHGDEEAVREIGRMDIGNVGAGLKREGETWCFYSATKDGQELDGVVYHKRENGAWNLVAATLDRFEVGGI